MGGDEFLVALVGARAELAEEIVGRLVEALASIEFGPARETLTVSAGVALFPRHAHELGELIACADSALYRAKASRRTRVHVASAPAEGRRSDEEQTTERHRLNLQNAVGALARAVDARDGETHRHSRAVAALAVRLGRALGMDEEHVGRLRHAGVLHDVGKIGVPDAILCKKGPLTIEEMKVMRRHSSIGKDIAGWAAPPEVADWICHLHERVDGGGYPDGLSGEAIPLESRVLHVADAVDAMTYPRVYHEPRSGEDALAELRRGAGTQFDPRIVSMILGFSEGGELILKRETEVAGADAEGVTA